MNVYFLSMYLNTRVENSCYGYCDDYIILIMLAIMNRVDLKHKITSI